MHQQDVAFKGLLGQGKVGNPVMYLAMFTDGPDAQAAIGRCFERIAASRRAGDAVCDLSQEGDVEAWSKNWHQLQWPGPDQSAA